MVNVMYFVHHLLLNVLFENRLMLFDKHMMKIFLKIYRLIPKQKQPDRFYRNKFSEKSKLLLFDKFQDM